MADCVTPEMQTNILQVVRKHSQRQLLKWATDSSKLKVVRVDNENCSNVFRVQLDDDDSDGTSVIVKYLPQVGLKSGGESAQTPTGELEYKALEKFESLSPGSVLKPVFYDSEAQLLCMEDPRDYVIYRRSLIDGNLDDDAARKLARDVAIIHRDTHVARIGEDGIKSLDQVFKNVQALTDRANLLFTAPFTRDDPTNRCSEAVKARLDWLYSDEEVIRAASNMKKVFLEKKEALVHGDLHTGSVMVKEKDARLIDTGFTYVGPCSLDIGILVANYIFTYYCHLLNPVNNDDNRIFAYRVVDMCNQTVDKYLESMTSVTGDTEIYQAKFISEAAGFAGCEIVRRLVGADHVEEFTHTDDAEVDALGAGVRLLKAYHRIHSIGTLMLIALMLA